MSSTQIRLSVEELAYAMGVLGGADVAGSLLSATLGERPRSELDGRLLAASHSLVARDLMNFDAASGAKSISSELEALVSPLLRHKFSLRCSRSARGREDVFSVFFADSGIVSHDRSRAIVSVLERLPVPADAITPCVAFFGLETSSTPDDGLLAEVPADLVEEIHRQRADLSAAEITSRLEAQGLSGRTAIELAADFLAHDYRGSAVRIDIRGDQAVSDRGCLILKSGGRAWCFDIVPGTSAVLRLFRGTPHRLAGTLSALIASS